METILLLTNDVQGIRVGVGTHLHEAYPASRLTIRPLDSDLVAELAQLPGELLPRFILVDSCVDSLHLLKELKAHSRLHHLPILMLRADATQRKAHFELSDN